MKIYAICIFDLDMVLKTICENNVVLSHQKI